AAGVDAHAGQHVPQERAERGLPGAVARRPRDPVHGPAALVDDLVVHVADRPGHRRRRHPALRVRDLGPDPAAGGRAGRTAEARVVVLVERRVLAGHRADHRPGGVDDRGGRGGGRARWRRRRGPGCGGGGGARPGGRGRPREGRVGDRRVAAGRGGLVVGDGGALGGRGGEGAVGRRGRAIAVGIAVVHHGAVGRRLGRHVGGR